jgi:hypothetical protein
MLSLEKKAVGIDLFLKREIKDLGVELLQVGGPGFDSQHQKKEKKRKREKTELNFFKNHTNLYI